MLVSLILPCYDPPTGWEQTVLSEYAAFCRQVPGEAELIIVMDGASDTVHEATLNTLRHQLPRLNIIAYTENRGKGYAIRQGVAAAKGDIIIYTDIDFPYTQESIGHIHQALTNGDTDVAVGVKNDAYYAQVPYMRRLISQFLRFFIRLFLSMPITDTQCGLKGFRKEVAPLFLRTTIDRYLFDLEFIRNCFKSRQFKVQPIPIALKENIRFRSMNYRILLPEMVNFIRLLFK